jgi:hypothetical protein
MRCGRGGTQRAAAAFEQHHAGIGPPSSLPR